ncbi:hypothetical protein CPB83DRAFT_692599 [Crepidotus variabilis]|uniref:Uncharacterized protein n=1 Tax=Crepidotus variabilis TaxID=179855 RepID=A0A9P6E6P9_9AGAR|nr:hypothetical protein CPB83DRAFT_692599 [Crepidotus variabilis]
MIYSLFFLGIPNFYIPSISVILDKVQRAEDDIHRLALVEGGGTTKEMILCDLDQSPDPWKVPHGYKDLQKSWHELVDNRTNEWVMLMTLSGMVFAGVVAFTQISGSSANPFMKNALQLSALCALTSIMGGAVYTFKFKAIRRTSMSIEWALDIRKSQGNVFWNTSLVLSLPAVWFVWSLLLCLTCILYYVLAPIPMDPEEYHSTFWHSLNIAGRVFVVGNLCSAVVQAFKVFYTFRRWRYDKLMSRLKEPPDPSSYISERLPSESSHPHFPPVQVDLENASSRRPNPSVPYSFDCTRLAGCRDAYTHGKSFMARVLPVAW